VLFNFTRLILNKKIMKKIILSAVVVFVFGFANAQDKKMDKGGGQTSEGKWLIEANTGTWSTGNTSFSLLSVDGGDTAWSVGVEGGYFVVKDLALKVGLGYSDDGSSYSNSLFNYKIGAKYYIASQFPVGIDFTGTSSSGDNASWVGFQGGYAWFVSDNVSIEPAIRYNATLDDNKAANAFQGLIGFALHF
jgi:hypothetical protein